MYKVEVNLESNIKFKVHFNFAIMMIMIQEWILK